MRKRIATAAVGVMCLVAPAAAQSAVATSDATGPAADGREGYEQRYLKLRDRYVEEFGLRSAGRDIVRDGYLERDGDVRAATRQEVLTSTERMQLALDPAEAAAASYATATTAYATTAAPTSVIQCESGGDYTAVNPAGYYGAYQFDQQTWDAYAPEGYAGTSPATAPPAVQDAAAASVPYDAWPNC